MKRIVIIGATSSIAEHCARLWAKEPTDFSLVGRQQGRLDLIAADLKVRSPQSRISTYLRNFVDPEAIKSTVAALCSTPVDIVLIAHGSLPEQQACQSNLTLCQSTIEINAVSPVLFAEAFAEHLEKQKHGTLAIIGSVAGDRGRKSNYVYGAAKGLVARYTEGLQHRFANTGVRVVLIKPGPTDTPMTAELKAMGSNMASPNAVAQCIIDGIAKNQRVIYAPKIWSLIMLVIRHLPAFIFNKMNI